MFLNMIPRTWTLGPYGAVTRVAGSETSQVRLRLHRTENFVAVPSPLRPSIRAHVRLTHGPPGDREEHEEALKVSLRRLCCPARCPAPRAAQPPHRHRDDRLRRPRGGAAAAGSALRETGLAQARTYAAEHGDLAVTDRTRHNGHPLVRRLLHQRHRVADGRIENTRIAALKALAPHWSPPWPLAWQRAYHRAGTDGPAFRARALVPAEEHQLLVAAQRRTKGRPLPRLQCCDCTGGSRGC